MTSFDFQPRTRVVFGAGSIQGLGELATSLGGSRALLVSDPGIVAAGHPQTAMRLLEAAGVEVFLFDQVEENPTTDHVNAGLEFVQGRGVDLIIGLGGGSSLDCARGINFLLTNGGRMADYWGVGKATKQMLPFISIPTTAGTGSEAQSYALIADPVTHRKMACGDPKAAAAIALLDPELTLTQPALVTAVAGMDAIVHALETLVATKRNPISEVFSQRAWQLLSHNYSLVLREPDNLEARAGMQLGAHFAGAAIENSMLGAAHACANPLTARFDVTHGAAVGLMLPAVIRFNACEQASLYETVGGAENVTLQVEDLMEQAALPVRLSEYGVGENDVSQLAEDAAKQWTAQFNIPKPFSPDQLLLTLKKAEERESLRREVTRLREEVSIERRYRQIIAKAPAMTRALEIASKVARHPSPVLITGESGTG
jgi:alcohol dehydrogenase